MSVLAFMITPHGQGASHLALLAAGQLAAYLHLHILAQSHCCSNEICFSIQEHNLQKQDLSFLCLPVMYP